MLQRAWRRWPSIARLVELSSRSNPCLTMANRAIGFALDVVLLPPNLRCAILRGIHRERRRGEYQLARPNEPLRLAVAFQAPLHVQRRFAMHERHLVDLAVTRRAATPLRT